MEINWQEKVSPPFEGRVAGRLNIRHIECIFPAGVVDLRYISSSTEAASREISPGKS
jgi:hypothetical protein